MEVSKLQRRLGKAEKALAALAKAAAGGGGGVSPATVLWYVQLGVYAAIVLAVWWRPVARLPPRWLAPLGATLRLPGQPPGSVSAAAWLTACHAVLAPAVGGAAQLLGVLPPPKEVNMMQRLMGMVTGALK